MLSALYFSQSTTRVSDHKSCHPPFASKKENPSKGTNLEMFLIKKSFCVGTVPSIETTLVFVMNFPMLLPFVRYSIENM